MIIYGKNINMRTVVLKDAKFIYDMRQNVTKTKYLSKIDSSVKQQENWINSYKAREEKKEEFYFVIESKANERLGLVRMYDFQDDSFCWGSWLIKDDAPKTAAIESALQVYEFGFYGLNFKQSHFDVRKGNDKVISFHKRFGANVVSEDDMNYYFRFTEERYRTTKEKYKRFLG